MTKFEHGQGGPAYMLIIFPFFLPFGCISVLLIQNHSDGVLFWLSLIGIVVSTFCLIWGLYANLAVFFHFNGHKYPRLHRFLCLSGLDRRRCI